MGQILSDVSMHPHHCEHNSAMYSASKCHFPRLSHFRELLFSVLKGVLWFQDGCRQAAVEGQGVILSHGDLAIFYCKLVLVVIFFLLPESIEAFSLSRRPLRPFLLHPFWWKRDPGLPPGSSPGRIPRSFFCISAHSVDSSFLSALPQAPFCPCLHD